ncbi:MAG: acylphosphatase, partial [Nitrososphaerales archaeon]
MDAAPEIEAISMRVEGIVQRVGFRRFVERAAWKSRLSGLVENLQDGSVRIFVQGSRASLDEFASTIEHAPQPIVVERVESKKAKVVPRVKSFRIKTGSLAVEMQEGLGAMESQFNDYRGEFREFSDRTDGNFRSLNNTFNDYRGEFREFSDRTDGNFRSLNNTFNDYRGEFREFSDRTDG